MPQVADAFRRVSLKKIGIAALLAVNAATLVNSAVVGHTVTYEGLGTGDASPLVNTLIAPAFTGMVWYHSAETLPTPIGYVANQTKKILPRPVDTGVGVLFAIAGAPGAWAGYPVGFVTGFATRLTHDLSR